MTNKTKYDPTIDEDFMFLFESVSDFLENFGFKAQNMYVGWDPARGCKKGERYLLEVFFTPGDIIPDTDYGALDAPLIH